MALRWTVEEEDRYIMELDGRESLRAIESLLANDLPIRYAGFRLEGDPEDGEKEMWLDACAGVWPHPSQSLEVGDIIIWQAAVGMHHYQLTVLAANQAVYMARVEEYRKKVLNARLRPDTAADQSELMVRWDNLPEKERVLVLATAEAEARMYGLPIAFIWFRKVIGTDKPYVQLWHPQYLPSLIALEMVQYLYRNATAQRNN